MNSVVPKQKKKRKNITLGIAHVQVTFNNTLVYFSDVQGNVIAFSSSGANGFKGAKKATPFAAQVVVEKAAAEAKEHGLKTISIHVKGAGSQRESALRAFFNAGFIVTVIKDVSSVAFNGCRAPKRRRV